LNELGGVNATVNELHEAQMAINHNHLVLLNEVRDRVKNSGTLVLSDKEIVTKIFSGLIMYLDPRDMAISIPTALDGIWEHRITAAWQSIIESHDTVLDIGSNNGYYGALAAQKTDKKDSKVILFEANPNLIPYIKKTLAANWLNEQTVLEHIAIADKPGELTLHVLQDYIGSSSVHSLDHLQAYAGEKMYLKTKEEIKVRATSIDLYCKEHAISAVDAMIMDIEGYEDIAYAGMRKTVQNSSRLTLFIEFTKDSYKDAKGFYNLMLQDFGNVYVLNDDGRFVKPKDVSYEAVIGDADDWVMPIFSKRGDLTKG
jgi:FkbM family methyltransferase